MAVLAIDVGGTKIAAGIVGDDGSLSTATRVVSTPRRGGPDDVWDALARLATGVRGSAPLDGCGVGCGGPMTQGGETVSPLNITGWRGFPLRSRLQQLTRLDTFVDNDAKALALAEGWIGAARGEPNFIAMVVSTGVGGGIVLDGRLLGGAAGNAGHIGHVIVEPGGELCVCGARGCLEAVASGPAIERITGRPPAEAGHPVRARVGRLVGRAVADVSNLLDLRLAVVAGSVALGFGDPFFASAQAELDASARLEFSRGARIVPAGLGADAPLVGAAAVALRGLGRLPGIG